MSTTEFPLNAEDLTKARLTELLRSLDSTASVESFVITDSKQYGDGSDQVSTANRIELDVVFDGHDGHRQQKMVLKCARPDLVSIPLYRNEVNFYTRVAPLLELEVPRSFGGEFHQASGTFGLALENLRERNASFPNVKSRLSLADIRALLDTLSTLHARFWESRELSSELDYIESHTHGDLWWFFNSRDAVPAVIQHEMNKQQYKRELVEAAGQTELGLYNECRKLQQHQATLPYTLCHGDTHIGNTYLLPDGRAGLLDWQMMAKGYFMHDLAYIMITSMPVAQRRAHQGEMLAYYLRQLRAKGATNVPDMEAAWLEYRRAAVWGVYIGWLTCAVENYGWDINVCNHVRLLAAYSDLETSAALANLPDAPPMPTGGNV
jgi:thiamine kinase-like enzyme